MNNLKTLRIENNLLQNDLAKLLKISQNGYSQYENSQRNIPINILKILAKHYNTSIDYLVGITNNRKPYKKSIIKNEFKDINRLKEIREDRDLTQIEIAKLLNMSRAGYSLYEININEIPVKNLIKLADFYNLSIDYILYLTDQRTAHDKVTKEEIT